MLTPAFSLRYKGKDLFPALHCLRSPFFGACTRQHIQVQSLGHSNLLTSIQCHLPFWPGLCYFCALRLEKSFYIFCWVAACGAELPELSLPVCSLDSRFSLCWVQGVVVSSGSKSFKKISCFLWGIQCFSFCCFSICSFVCLIILIDRFRLSIWLLSILGSLQLFHLLKFFISALFVRFLDFLRNVGVIWHSVPEVTPLCRPRSVIFSFPLLISTIYPVFARCSTVISTVWIQPNIDMTFWFLS